MWSNHPLEIGEPSNMPSLWLGLISWLAIGVFTGAFAARLLPGHPRLALAPAILVGIGGALAGGVAATALGFGGLAGFDVRALAVATLAAVLALLVLRLKKLPAAGTR